MELIDIRLAVESNLCDAVQIAETIAKTGDENSLVREGATSFVRQSSNDFAPFKSEIASSIEELKVEYS
jgi:hypothetical protein